MDARGSNYGDLLIAVKPAASVVGAVVTARRGIRTENAMVIGLDVDGFEVVWPSGEIHRISGKKVKTTISPPATDVRSVPGRLYRLIYGKGAEPYRTDASGNAVLTRFNELISMRDHAMGLLLDRKPLGLNLSSCLGLPLEPWRVRYEFLRSSTSNEEATRLANDIVLDANAPSGVRTLVSVKSGISQPGTLPAARLVFDGIGATSHSALTSAATDVASCLEPLGFRTASWLGVAATTPTHLSEFVGAAGVLAAREQPCVGKRVAVGGGTPLTVIDDLIDRGVPVDTAEGASVSLAGHDRDVPLSTYVLARTEPQQLSSEQVVSLKFQREAERRYLAGDASVEPALDPDAAASVKFLRSVVAGNALVDAPADPSLLELWEVLTSSGAKHPSEALLADRSLWPVLIGAGVEGVARAGPLGSEFAELSALTRAQSALFEWRWNDARNIVRDGLRQARRESVRDELLNIMACALWLQGQPEPALAALDNALEGEYSDALLINASVVAMDLDRDAAVERLVKLAREAPSADQRAAAAERALFLWLDDDGRLWEHDSEQPGLPVEIRDALRSLISSEIPDDRYIRILRVLSVHDDEWLADQPNSAFGRNTGRASTRLFRARAVGIDEFVGALASVLRAGVTEPWIEAERDSIVDAAIEVLFERNDELPAAFFGLSVIDADLPVTVAQGIALRCLTVASIAGNMDPSESEPKERFITFVEEAHLALMQLESDERNRLQGLATHAAEKLTGVYLQSRYRQFDDVIDAYNTMAARVRAIPSRNLNRQAVAEAFMPITSFCSDTWKIFDRLGRYLDDPELIDLVRDMMSQASDIGHRATSVVR